jgi:hypothetical protein
LAFEPSSYKLRSHDDTVALVQGNRVMKRVVQVVAGSVGLGWLIANPAAFELAVEAAQLVGANPFTAILGLLSLITAGLSIGLHAALDIGNALGILTSGVVYFMTALLTIIDAAAFVLNVMWSISNVTGFLENIPKFIALVVGLGNAATALSYYITTMRTNAYASDNCPSVTSGQQCTLP